jgi:hypothetical protein
VIAHPAALVEIQVEIAAELEDILVGVDPVAIIMSALTRWSPR